MKLAELDRKDIKTLECILNYYASEARTAEEKLLYSKLDYYASFFLDEWDCEDLEQELRGDNIENIKEEINILIGRLFFLETQRHLNSYKKII